MTRPRNVVEAVLFWLLAVALLEGQESRPGAAQAKPARWSVESFTSPEVIGLRPLPSSDGIAVVTSSGVVHFHDAKGGQQRRTVATGVSGWRHAVEMGGRRNPPVLRGIPITVQDENVLAVEGTKLFEFDSQGAKRILCEDQSLTGATMVRGTGRDGPVLVGTTKGLLCSIAGGKAKTAPQPLDQAVLVIAVAPNRAWCLSAGEGPAWQVRDLATLNLTKTTGNHLGEGLIYTIEVSKDSEHIAVAHGYTTCRIKAFSVTGEGLVGEIDAARTGNGVCTTIAYDSSMKLLVAGDETGAVRVLPSGIGDAKDLPRSTRIADDGGGPIASSMTDFRTGKNLLVSDLGSWRVDDEPIRGVCFADDGKLVISVNRTGMIVARSWPSGDIKWTKTISL
jgi:hypothetical protein